MECQFPNCRRNAEKNGYCVGHTGFAKKSSGQVKEEEKAEAAKEKFKKKESPSPGVVKRGRLKTGSTGK